jgi:hypothetical protein
MKNTKPEQKWIIGAFVLSTLGFIAYIFYLKLLLIDNNLSEKVSYATIISAISGSIWSLASFVLFYTTLTLQREELEETRGVLVEQQKQMIQANELTKKQQFDSQFFQLLSFFNDFRKNLQSTPSDPNSLFALKNVIGVNIFEKYFNVVKEEVKSLPNDLNFVKQKYNQASLINTIAFSMYWGNLNELLIKIADSNFEDTVKEKYINLVAAQLTHYELLILTYNFILIGDFKEKFPLFKQYNLTKSLNLDENITSLQSSKYYLKEFLLKELKNDKK